MAPERTAAINHLADSYAKVAAALGDFGEYLDHVAALLRKGLVVLIVVGVILIASAANAAYNGFSGARARTKLLRQSAQIKRTADEVHSAVTPGQQIYTKGQADQAAVVTLLATEADCRNRRALAHLPMPDPARPCVSQTPAQVLNH